MVMEGRKGKGLSSILVAAKWKKILYEVVDLDWNVLLPKVNKQPAGWWEFCIDINSKKINV